MTEKWKSRTFIFSCLWSSFVPLAIIVQIFIPSVEIPIAEILPWSGGITLAYVGGNKVRDSVKENKAK